MIGAIRKRDVLAHPFVTVDCFGWRVFLKTLVAGRNQTFLSVLTETDSLCPPRAQIPDVVERCVELELRAKAAFEFLAKQHATNVSVAKFFESIAEQEQSHAELLALCQEAASRAHWNEQLFAPWRDVVPQLEKQMKEHEQALPTLTSRRDALRFVLDIEGSELNHVFRGVVAATDSDFVTRLCTFQTAGAKHIAFICGEIAKMEPSLARECQQLAASFRASA